MKVLLVNGSPHPRGCTWTALCEVASALRQEGIETEIFQAGGPMRGCMACGYCASTHRCAFSDGRINEALDILKDCDGLIVGSPVHYAAASGSITSFLDRLFHAGGSQLRGKVGAAVVSARRAGTTAALDQLQKYFTICAMPTAPSQYWPMVHGSTPEDVLKDEEGLQIMRSLGRWTAYMVKSFALAREAGLLPPEQELPKARTDFIR